MQEFITELMELKGLRAVDCQKINETTWLARLEAQPTSFSCSFCGHLTHNHGDSNKHRIVRHRYIPGVGFLDLSVPVLRRQCSSCGSTETVFWPGVQARNQYTDAFIAAAVKACHGRTIQSVRKEWQIGYSTLERWYYDQTRCLLPNPTDHASPEVLCLDEHAIHKQHKYHVAVMDHQTGHVWGVAKGRGKTILVPFLQNWPFPTAPKVVVTDLAAGFARIVRKVWPQTQVVADRFHVIGLFIAAMERGRKKNKGLTHRTIRYQRSLLAKKPQDLTEPQSLDLATLWAEQPLLQPIYQALQEFRSLYREPNPKEAIRQLTIWLATYADHELKSLRRLAKTIRRWQKAIEASFIHPVSNGPMEGTNNHIKVIKRRAFGYRNPDHFIHRIRLECKSA